MGNSGGIAHVATPSFGGYTENARYNGQSQIVEKASMRI